MLRFLKRQTELARVNQIRQLGLFSTLKPTRVAGHRRPAAGTAIPEGRDRLRRGRGRPDAVYRSQRNGLDLPAGRTGDRTHCRGSAGALFGELALLDGAPRSAQARAAEDCVLASLSRADFKDLVETNAVIASKIAFQLAWELGQKLREGLLTADRRPL